MLLTPCNIKESMKFLNQIMHLQTFLIL